MMRFSPSFATRIRAAPVDTSGITRTPEVRTPIALKFFTVSAPNMSPPTAATMSTRAPQRAAATAWLAPLPPKPMSNPVPNTVSPPLGTTSLMNCRSVLQLPTTAMRGVSATWASCGSRRSDVLHGITFHERYVEHRRAAGDGGPRHALLQQLHGTGADGRERLRYRRQPRADDPGPADVIEAGHGHIAGNVDLVLGEEVDGIDGDQVIACDDERGSLTPQQSVPGLAAQDAVESNADLPCDREPLGQRADETVAPLLGAFQIARSGQQPDTGVALLQSVLREQLSAHQIVRMDGRESGPGAVDQHDRSIERSQWRGELRSDRAPDDTVDAVLRKQCQPITLALGAALTVDEAHQQAESARRVLHGLRQLREERVGEVRQNEADGARAPLAHRLRGAMRPITELLGRAQDLLPHRRADVRLVVQNVGNGSDRDADSRGKIFYGCHPAGCSPPPLSLQSRRSIHAASVEKNV